MKKLKIDVADIERREKTPHYDFEDELLAKQHYGNYVVINKNRQGRGQRMYLSLEHHLEYYAKRKALKIKNIGVKPKEFEYHLFTKYPDKKIFISDVLLQILPNREEYAKTNSILIAFSFYIETMLQKNIVVEKFDDIKTEHQRIVWNALTNNNKIEMVSLFFSTIANISEKFIWIKPTKVRKSRHLKALDTSVVYQINHYAKLEITEIINRREEYLEWLSEYENKELFSLENLVHTYYSYIEKYGSNANGRVTSIKKLAIELYGINIKAWKYISKEKYYYINQEQEKQHMKLQKLALKGSDIWITSEKMFALWFKELCPDFPFSKDVQEKYKNVYTNIQAFRNNIRKKLDIDIVHFDSRIFPSSTEIYPLILLLMIRTNLNSDVLRLWSVECIKDNIFTLGDQTGIGLKIEAIKYRGNTYQSIVLPNNSFEKKVLDYYLNWLQPVFVRSESKLFFQYVNSGKSKAINEWKSGRYFTKISASKRSLFYKYEIIDDDRNRVLRIDHRRLRTTGNYINYLKGLNEFERQVKLGHSEIVTQKYYINSDDWINKDRHEILKTQEVVVKIARGDAVETNFAKKFNAILADCFNPSMPDYPGAPKLDKGEICSNWLKCLTQCTKSIVIPKIHGGAIVAWKNFMEEEQDKFISIEFWEKEYGMDYGAACSVIDGFEKDELAYAKEKAREYKNLVNKRFRKTKKVRVSA